MDLNEKLRELEKIHPELNIEKWPIWQPTNSRVKLDTLTLERTIQLQDGSSLAASVEISANSNYGPLTTEDQKVYYALLKLWEEAKKPTTTSFFLRQLARVLKKSWGKSTSIALIQSLLRLRSTFFVWRHSFFDANTKGYIRRLDTFNILSELSLSDVAQNGQVKVDTSNFRFSEHLLINLDNCYTKPLILDVIISFKSEFAQILYRHLDLVMANKTIYERNTQDLFYYDLNLRVKEYAVPSRRKHKLETILNEFKDCRLSTGTISSIKIEKVKAGNDYKLVIKKTPYSPKESQKGHPLPSTENHDVSAWFLLIQKFYRIFHQCDNDTPSVKEIIVAKGWIDNYGEELANRILDYSVKQAKKTKYLPQTFCGIKQYEQPALTSITNKTLKEEKLPTTQDGSKQLDKQKLANLPNEVYEALYQKASQEVLSIFPEMEQQPNSEAVIALIHRQMVNELENKEK